MQTAGVRLYFRNFDVDDPSADTAPIDTNDSPTVKVGNDNNGNVDGTTATRAGVLVVPATGQPNPFNCVAFSNANASGVSCETDSNGVAKVDYKLTMQPGDNFSVVASPDETYVSSLVPANDGINLKDANNIETPVTITGNNSCAYEFTGNKACRSDMLTVWRRLHIEYDSMGNVTGNRFDGTFSAGGKIGQGNQTLSINTPPLLEANRFENGRIVIGNRSLRVIDATPTITANTTTTVTVSNNTGVFNISAGDSFTLYDDDDFNDDDDELTPDGDTLPSPGEDVAGPDLKLLTPDDVACPNTFDTNNCNIFLPAYVRPLYDLTTNQENTAFYANATDDNLLNIRVSNFQNRDYEANTDFWTIYLLGAYQFDTDNDGDPDSQNAILGRTDGDSANDGEGSVIFNEVNRPYEYDAMNVLNPTIPDWRTRPIDRRFTVAHEVGHLFGGNHTDTGLMAQSFERIGPLFSAITINKIRGGTMITHP